MLSIEQVTEDGEVSTMQYSDSSLSTASSLDDLHETSMTEDTEEQRYAICRKLWITVGKKQVICELLYYQ